MSFRSVYNLEGWPAMSHTFLRHPVGLFIVGQVTTHGYLVSDPFESVQVHPEDCEVPYVMSGVKTWEENMRRETYPLA